MIVPRSSHRLLYASVAPKRRSTTPPATVGRVCHWAGWVLTVLAACGPKPTVMNPADQLPFAFEARNTWGEVRVIPALVLIDPLPLNEKTHVGSALPPGRRSIRALRTEQLHEVPAAVGRALPGEVNGLLGLSWPGQFHVHRLGQGTLDRLADAVSGQRPDLHSILAHTAQSAGGRASLFSWVLDLQGEPLSLRGFPGEVVHTEIGPVVLDHEDEPYLVEAEVGMALVAEDGEVVLRYQDTYHALLSSEADPYDAGRMLARGLAEEVVTMWSLDPRLGDLPPVPPRRYRAFQAPTPDATP